MNKYEFLIRFSMVNQKKPAKIRQYLRQIQNDIDDGLLLHQLKWDSAQIRQFYQLDIQKTLDWIHQDNHFLISYDEPRYPDLLKQISSPPLLLFGIGDRELLSTTQIAMVGSRIFSEYGAQWARYFASELAINGLTITSGLALGIDAICHRGALDVSGKTIAVLGSGLLNITPKTNYHLAQNILASGGCIISEFLPQIIAHPKYFPRRNRIISGLSLGTFVVEASQKSGSLITARYALEQNRDVFALPGDISNENYDGTHWLIKQGAYLVTKPIDILEHYASSLSWIKPHTDDQSLLLPMIHPEIFALINHQPISADMIVDKIGQSATDVAIKLMELELEGAIRTINGGYVRDKAI
ncbi:DNA processing protein [Orbus hercynius]|uniref:DNA processing protein n=1 Tax=Orbus hercynius TaxID=593135 RepID=A0A495REP5_9GAMM|nr:DNA-processing protein DprA [Orbus hercynius]RKS85835.1 DNA processing protein [Orbus hercynius]